MIQIGSIFILLCVASSILADKSGLAHGKSKKFDVKPVSEDKAKEYLQTFGYVNPTNLQSGGAAGGFDLLKNAIMKFQEYAGLSKTGVLDTQTKKKMAMPRCGITDEPMALTAGGPRAVTRKWSRNHITYSIDSWTPDLPRDTVRRAIREAYDKWSAVAPITFEEVSAGQGDIKVKFGSYSHGDPWPFDGDGGVLAHATMPENGALHFDDSENWAYKDADKIGGDYTDLLAVAIHEGGHTLGLEHSRDDNAIMAPFYQSTVDDYGNYNPPELKSDDIRAIQAIYGRGSGRSSSGSSFGGSGFGSRFTTRAPSWGGSSGFGSSGFGSSFGSGSGWDSGSSFGRNGGRFGSSGWGDSSDRFGSGGSSFGSSGGRSSGDSLIDRFFGRNGGSSSSSSGSSFSSSNSGSSSSSSGSSLLDRARGFLDSLGR
ncbi:hypothetical protein WR25_16279 isoform B [Diploscapter pachys]|uniref:Peptidase metallopeptidase domain-containing protein n=2 Tax=Diploscapter pachys TaxID=2018661 RepID=A0A2A2L8G9_9BILA|nr:hypothetical protein WR25_16279 isoform B [Diploscapter pachys]